MLSKNIQAGNTNSIKWDFIFLRQTFSPPNNKLQKL